MKNYKTFKIGDGMKSICVSDRYCAELDEDQSTLLLFDPETDDVWIRITVITVESKDNAENVMFDYVINLAKEQDKEVEIIGDKNYLVDFHQFEEGGDQCITYHYHVGYKCHSVVISVTTCLENSITEEFKLVLAEIPEYIASIQEIS